MRSVECPSVGIVVEVDDDGRFELPDRLYSTTDLKRIARDINRVVRESKTKEALGQEGVFD